MNKTHTKIDIYFTESENIILECVDNSSPQPTSKHKVKNWNPYILNKLLDDECNSKCCAYKACRTALVAIGSDIL